MKGNYLVLVLVPMFCFFPVHLDRFLARVRMPEGKMMFLGNSGDVELNEGHFLDCQWLLHCLAVQQNISTHHELADLFSDVLHSVPRGVSVRRKLTSLRAFFQYPHLCLRLRQSSRKVSIRITAILSLAYGHPCQVANFVKVTFEVFQTYGSVP